MPTCVKSFALHGDKPIAVFVLFHRAIKKDGSISSYRWGVKRKRPLFAREQNCKDFCLE
jgi:AraC family transcriptional regulator, regulatory protein of adaptative response / methylated-DNA-[protein]-cysteine methyltransferase